MSHDNDSFDLLWSDLRASIREAFDSRERRIMRISHRLTKALDDLERINHVRKIFFQAGATDFGGIDRREGLRRARVGMLCYAMELETAKP
jgi:hypothetical protein